MATHSNAIVFEGVTKRFGDFVAVDSASFSVKQGAIHGIVGENGAGKSTIMKVLYGLYPLDGGRILYRGAPTHFSSPMDAIRRGIGMVHQHFMFVPTLPVWKNICLGVENTVWLDTNAIIAEIDALQRKMGLSLDLNRTVESLSVGEQQQVEILKILYRRAEVLILDEPTAVLIPQEVESLFARLRELNAQGKTILLITHKLHEILEFTQSVTVMRAGKVITTQPTASLNRSQLAEAIIGREARSLSAKLPTASQGKAAPLRLSQVGVHRKKETRARLSDITLELRPGEIVGVAGISGNGQQELIETLTRVIDPDSGEITLFDKPLWSFDRYEMKQQGFGLIPADRNSDGLVGTDSIAENLTLGHQREERYTRGIFRSLRKIRKEAEPLLDRFDIRPKNADAMAGRLSGGNQQKVIIAREVTDGLKVLVAAYPTRGVDIGAIEFIYDLLLKKRAEGAAILLISSELDELFCLSDRIVVLYEGRIVGEVDPKAVTPEQIGLLMTGGRLA